MEGKGNRGAYAQVTAPIEDDSKVTIEQGGKSQGMRASSTQKRLIIIAVVVALVVIIGIIVVAVVVTNQNNKSEESFKVLVTTMKAVAPTVTKAMTTTPAPPPTTFGPAVAGLFQGTFVMNRTYDQAFDDIRAPLTSEFKANITAAMDLIFSDRDAPYMYVSTIVDQLLQNGTYVQVDFTVSLDAINRGGRAHLLTALGSVPSTRLATYPVLYAGIQEEKKPSLDA